MFDDFFGSKNYNTYWQNDGAESYIIGIDPNGYKAVLVETPQRPDDMTISPLPSIKSILKRCDRVMSWEYPTTLAEDLSGLNCQTVVMRTFSDGVEFTTTPADVNKRTLGYGVTEHSNWVSKRSHLVDVPTLISILDGPVLTMWDKAKPPLYLSTERDGTTKLMTIKPTLGELIRRNLPAYAETNNRLTHSAFSVPLPEYRNGKD